MKIIKRLIYLLISVFAFSSCTDIKEDFTISNVGWDYFPLNQNMYWIYKVDSITYALEGTSIDTTSSYIREEIVEVFVDNVQDTIYRIERYYSDSLNGNWRVTDEWSARINSIQAIRTEENLKFIKLTFPFNENKRWNGNSQIIQDTIIVAGENIDEFYEDWDYEILRFDTPDTINNIFYQNVATIQNADSETLLNRKFAFEKYAKDIGLVQKYHFFLFNDSSIGVTDSVNWEEIAHKGYIMDMQLIEYGN